MKQEMDFEALASQLSHPKGEHGAEVSDLMESSNKNMTCHSIIHLDIPHTGRILELGHGNGKHIREFMNPTGSTVYFGLEISELMHEYAIQNNQELINSQHAEFRLYNGENIPYPDDSFDRVYTVNTIYFWKNPSDFLAEIYRITRPGGRVNITFAHKSFMETLPFTRFGFTLYDHQGITDIVSTTSFTITDIISETEIVTSKMGDEVEREFSTVILKK